MAHPYAEVQTVEVGGIPYTEYRQEPELENEQGIELGNTEYITVVKDPQKRTNRYLVTLLNRFNGSLQRVDLVIQEHGFTAMMNEIRKHFGSGWEVFAWADGDTPF
jgi:hypothetical protein